MGRIKVEELVEKIAEPIASKNNCEVIDVEFKKEGTEWFLRVFIDKDQGVTIDDCEAVSRELSDQLDKLDPIKQSYYLEVSSPGINRVLKKDKDFLRFIGHKIAIKLYQPLNGAKSLHGVLENYENNVITIKLDEENKLEIERSKIAQARLADDDYFI